jgi:hypothetical protein
MRRLLTGRLWAAGFIFGAVRPARDDVVHHAFLAGRLGVHRKGGHHAQGGQRADGQQFFLGHGFLPFTGAPGGAAG